MNTEIMWTFETANLRITWEISPSDYLDLSWDDTGETRENIESGLWYAFDSRMVVAHKETGAILGEDHLGQSIYEKPSEFRDHIGMNAKGHGSYFSDMVREACSAARKSLSDLKTIPLRH